MPCRCVVVCMCCFRTKVDEEGRVGWEGKEKLGRSIVPRYGEDPRCSLLSFSPPYLLSFLLSPQGYFRSTKKRWKRGHENVTIRCETTCYLPPAEDSWFRVWYQLGQQLHYLRDPSLLMNMDWSERGQRGEWIGLWLVCELTESVRQMNRARVGEHEWIALIRTQTE